MSLAVPNPFRKRSTYLLQAEDLLALGSKRVTTRHFYSALTKRAVALMFVFVLAFSGAAGLFFSSAAAAPKASATIIDDWMCNGMNITDTAGADKGAHVYPSVGWTGLWKQTAAQSPSVLTVQKYSGAKTAYEEFTPFLPMFDSWSGLYLDNNTDSEVNYKASNGNEQKVTVLPDMGKSTTDATASPLLSHGGTDCQVLNSFRFATSSIANIIFFVPKVAVYIGAESYGWALDNEYISEGPDAAGNGGNALNPLLTAVDGLILGVNGSPGLKDQLYLPFLIPIIAMSALYFFYIGVIKRSTTAAISAFVWMLASIIAGVLFLSHPTWIPSWSDGLVKTVQTAVINALDSDPGVADMCKLPATTTGDTGIAGQAKTVKVTTPANATSREVKCAIWYTNIYVPWVSGQFNTSPSANYAHDYAYYNHTGYDKKGNITEAGQHYNALTYDPQGILSGPKAQSIKVGSNQLITNGVLNLGGKGVQTTWGTYEMANQLASVTSQTTYASDIAFAQLGAPKATAKGVTTRPINYTWTGTGMQQIGLAILATISSIGTLVLIVSSAFMLIAYEISTVFLVVLSPFFFLLGAIPGFGKRIMLRWFELMASLVVKRILVTFLVAIFLRLYTLIMNPSIELTWMLQVIMVTILAFVGISQRGKLVNMFSQGINFGGDKSISDGSDKVASVGQRAGATVASVGQRLGAGTVNAGIAKFGQTRGYNASGESNADFARKSGVLVKGDAKNPKDPQLGVDPSGPMPVPAGTRGPKPVLGAGAASLRGSGPVAATKPIAPMGGSGTPEDPWVLSDADAERADMPYDDGTRPSDRRGAGPATGTQAPSIPVPVVRPSMAQRVDQAKNAHKTEFDVAKADERADKKSGRAALAEGFMSGFSSKRVNVYGSYTSGFRSGLAADQEVQSSITAQANTERAIADQNLKGLELEQNEELEEATAQRAATDERLRQQEFDATQAHNAVEEALARQNYELDQEREANDARRSAELVEATRAMTDAATMAGRANVDAAKLTDQANQQRHEEMLNATREATQAARDQSDMIRQTTNELVDESERTRRDIRQQSDSLQDLGRQVATENQKTRGVTRDALKDIRQAGKDIADRRAGGAYGISDKNGITYKGPDGGKSNSFPPPSK